MNVVKAKIYGASVILTEELTWEDDPESLDDPDPNLLDLLNLITDPNALSGADPNPILNTAQRVQKILPALELISWPETVSIEGVIY